MRDEKGRFKKGIIPYNKGKGLFYLIECKNCKLFFFIPKGQYQNGRRKFCSRKCKYQFEKPTQFITYKQKITNLKNWIGRIPWNKGKPFYQIRGDKNHFWEGGVTEATRKRVGSIEWKILREQIYKRDNYTCQKCKRKPPKLHCHHIEPYRISQNNNLDNLITLCNSCHSKEEERLKKELQEVKK